jgi:hypothetical protein
VPAEEDEGVGGDVHYVTVGKTRTKVLKFVCLLVLTKTSPGLSINSCVSLKLLKLLLVIVCAFTFRS